jgi:hypothetical protein
LRIEVRAWEGAAAALLDDRLARPRGNIGMDFKARTRLAEQIAGAAVMLNMQDRNAALARALEQRRGARQDAFAIVRLLRVHEHATLQIDHQ